jgi:predicted dehydrogenase
MSKTKVAVIGAGALANAMHYPSLAGLDDVQLVGIFDLFPDKLAATAQRFGIDSTFSDYRQMLDKTAPDAVYALMPPHHIFDVAMDVLQAGHNLFIEKPPGLTTHQTMAMARLAEQKQLITGVGFQRRYHPLLHYCYEKVRDKGQPHQVAASFMKLQDNSDPHPYYRGVVDILTCDAIHALDSVRYYCGLSPVKSVSSVIRKLDSWYDTSFNALIHFENDAVGIFQSNWRCGGRFFNLELHAIGASAYVNIDGRAEIWMDGEPKPAIATDYLTHTGAVEADHYQHQGFQAQARGFIDAVKSGAPPHNNFADAVKTMELVEQVYACKQ